MKIFKDRVDGGVQLAHALQKYANKPDIIVIGLPRGGVVPAAEVARILHAPLDIIIIRKIGAPDNPELAVGALTQDGQIVWNGALMRSLQLTPDGLTSIIESEKKEAARRLQLYRGNKPPLNLNNKIVLLVDDGIATGATIRAAIATARAHKAKKIVIAVPVAPPDTVDNLAQEVDEVICLHSPEYFTGVGAFYTQFAQTTDDEVIALLQK